MTTPELLTTESVTETALPLVLGALRGAVAQRGRAVLVLAGGSTPLPLYRRLAQADLPWERVHIAWGDERFVPADHPDSNAGAAQAALVDLVPVPESHVHPWPILSTPEASAAAYQGELERALGPDPVLDVTLLGLGADGHTASLFPRTGDALRSGFALATTARAGAPVRERLTLSARTLGRSRLVAFLVSGADKAPALCAAFGPDAPLLRPGAPSAEEAALLDAHPSRAITALERLVVIADQRCD